MQLKEHFLTGQNRQFFFFRLTERRNFHVHARACVCVHMWVCVCMCTCMYAYACVEFLFLPLLPPLFFSVCVCLVFFLTLPTSLVGTPKLYSLSCFDLCYQGIRYV